MTIMTQFNTDYLISQAEPMTICLKCHNSGWVRDKFREEFPCPDCEVGVFMRHCKNVADWETRFGDNPNGLDVPKYPRMNATAKRGARLHDPYAPKGEWVPVMIEPPKPLIITPIFLPEDDTDWLDHAIQEILDIRFMRWEADADAWAILNDDLAAAKQDQWLAGVM